METQAWKQYIPEFREKTQQFYDGSMSQKDYKGFSGFYGSYAQRGGSANMLRLRMTAGRVTKGFYGRGYPGTPYFQGAFYNLPDHPAA